MEEITQKQNEISIMEIFRLLLSKLKYIVLVVILGAALGAGIGFLRTHNVEYYGTEIKFYINPSKDKGASVDSESQYGVYGAYGKNVLNNMVELLESEAFAEKLLLNDSGLPTDEALLRINNENLNTLVATATVAVESYQEKYQKMEDALTALTLANENKSAKETELNRLWEAEKLKNPTLPLTPQQGVSDEIDNAMAASSQATVNQIAAQQLYDSLYKETIVLSKNADEAKEPALALWRELDTTYRTKLNRIAGATRFSYYDEAADVEADDLARSFIYVNISVLNDKEYAEELRLLMIDSVKDYVIEKMPIPSGYNDTNCIRISRTDEVHRTNEGIVSKTATKYGLILGAASLIIACIVFIIIDRSDKRLRSIEQVTDVFGVPVLGVIPSFKETDKLDESKEEQTKEDVE